MIQSTPTLEQVLERFGDDLYRLALLLTADTAQAYAVLVRAASHLTENITDLSSGVPIGALLAALPPERRAAARRAPEWVATHDPRSLEGRVVAAVARLPRMQRLALGLR
ncbi:MAG TPA: hypothetical protein VFT99_05295, partial [Roseiflexaceae bacterium]|nr:hypothetical protein [Roseiflexaceae bacterium]